VPENQCRALAPALSPRDFAEDAAFFRNLLSRIVGFLLSRRLNTILALLPPVATHKAGHGRSSFTLYVEARFNKPRAPLEE